MPHTVEKQKDNKVKIILTIPVEEMEIGMKAAAQRLSGETKIKGFRAGKAPYDVIKQRFGEMKILEAAAEGLVRSAFVKALLEENLESVGQPYFNIEKMAPGNDMVVTAEVALYPHVIKLADYNKLSVKKKNVEPTTEMIEQAKKDLVRMQTKEIRDPKGHKLEKGDKAVVTLTMKKDGVVLEGGEAQNHGIYTNDPYYIEGFVDKILGAQEDEERTFMLKFPDEHYQKHLAGRDIEFTVKVNEIFLLEAPKIDDEFSKTLGLKNAKDLEKKLKENLQLENEQEESIRQDKVVLDLVAEKSDFEAIPDLLINQEIEKMLNELKHSVNQHGPEFGQYLQSIKKTVNDLRLDFAPMALTRIKVAIFLKKIAKDQNIQVNEKEVEDELDRIAAPCQDDKEAQKRIYSPRYRDYLEPQMVNRKTIDFLKERMVK
ncbi:trigger factor [Patescibacteria group bacterium]|nr:trigger factor [Patescibacteria group bacterium]